MASGGLSVVMPNFNHGSLIAQALEAILSQSRPPQEVIVIDDASTDDSVAIIERLARRHPNIRFLRNDRNQGAVAGLNRGLREAAGAWVHFASADDRILPGLYEKSLSLLAEHPESGLCSTVSNCIDASGRAMEAQPDFHVADGATYLAPPRALALLRGHDTWIMGNTALYSAKALRDEGGFAEELGPSCDGLLARVLALKHGACFLPEPLAVWRRSDAGLATRTAARPGESLALIAKTASIMRTRYAELFPEGYVRFWTRRRVLETARLASEGHRLALLASREALGAPVLGDRAFFALAFALNALERLASRAATFLTTRWPPTPSHP